MGDGSPNNFKLELMEKTIDFTELSDTELREISGGAFPVLLIKMFGPNIAGLMAFWDGLRDGYERTTQP